MEKHRSFLGIALISAVLILVGCQAQPASTEALAAATPCPIPIPCPDCPACPTPTLQDIPFESAWAASGHNKAEAEGFNHWNKEDPPEVPIECAKCHTSQGYQEFVSSGSVVNPVPAPAGTIQCETCHNAAAAALDSVKFPSGLEVTGTGPTSRCMVCHQGRESKVSIDDQLANFNAADPDTVPAPIKDPSGKERSIGFINIHYYAAGATLFGTQAKGGYEYDGKRYDSKFRHVEGIETCIGCHDPHNLQVQLEKCQECHTGVNALDDLKNIRMQGSLVDYDGDGNTTEGISFEVEGLREVLYSAIQDYAKSVAGVGLIYDEDVYPYFMVDADGDGIADKNDAGNNQAYATWTPRLLKAAYNFQTVTKDPGAFAHNAKYMIQLMYDSIADLNDKLGTMNMTALHRDDPGHFAGNTEPFRHWDAEGKVEAYCVKCHTAEGLPMFIENNATISVAPSNGFMCTTCHNEKDWPNRYVVTSVTFPSGAQASFGEKDSNGNFTANESNLCIECHQGQSSTQTVDKAVMNKDPQTPDPQIRFINIHYFAAGATLFGSEVQGAYQYEEKEYAGFNDKHPLNKCKDCHDVHALEVKVQTCAGCHSGATAPTDPATYRMDPTDYDGDGNTTEGIKAEIDAFAERLYAAIQAYAKEKGTPILYDPNSYPYYFVDANEDGEPDTSPNGLAAYNAWTPLLLKAGYNYQYYQKDPGAFTHNPKYVLQVLYDSIQSLGGDLAGLTRPSVSTP